MVETPNREIAPLLAGIIQDWQTLMRQEVALARSEVKAEVQKAANVAKGAALGAGLAGMAALLAVLGLVHLLSWAIPAIPLWGSYMIVGLGLGMMGGALLSKSSAAAKEIELAPKQTIESVKENAKWIAQSI